MAILYKNVIVFGGACSGKTTVAEHLRSNYEFARVSFAAPLKTLEAQVREYGWAADKVSHYLQQLFDDYEEYKCAASGKYAVARDILRSLPDIKDAANPEKPRERYQYLGHNFRELIAKDFWAVIGYHTVLQANKQGVSCVIDDGRYLNECSFFDEYRDRFERVALYVDPLVQRERYARLYGEPPVGTFEHSSERDIPRIMEEDCWIVNANIDADAMCRQVDRICIVRI